MYKKSTPEAKKLREALEKLGVHVLTEVDDGHKHIDLAIPNGRINIEVDGNQHFIDSHQIMSDLKRSHYSDHLGYDTIHIPNTLINSEVDKIAQALAEAASVREQQLFLKFKDKHKNRRILKGVIVENSLSDKSILDKIHVKRTWRAGDWTLHEIRIDDVSARELSKYMASGPWYIHLWEEGKDEVMVIFKNKIFEIKHSDRNTWTEAINYGKSIGIPGEQLDFLIN